MKKLALRMEGFSALSLRMDGARLACCGDDVC
jgi:hypothetical protein